MRALSAAELLDIWERGLQQRLVARSLSLLVAACPEQPAESLADLRIGARDALLLQLRGYLFGPRMTNTTVCPQCADLLEWESEVAELLSINPQEQDLTATACSIMAEGYQISFRLPNSRDLAALSTQQSAPARRQQLLERCLLEALQADGKLVSLGQLPDTAVQALVQEMERSDPQANLQLALHCPACGHTWQALFDIVSFLWAEINAWAERTLRAVHLLARAYGWREADVLGMSPRRRQLYLELASQ